MVLQNTDGDVKKFELLPAKTQEEEVDPATTTVGELTRRKFKMRVDSKEYEVYPDFRSISGMGMSYIDAAKYKKELEKLQNLQQSVAISRQITLKIFYEKFVYAVKKEAGNKGKLTQAQL